MYSVLEESRSFLASGDLSTLQNRIVQQCGQFKIGHALADTGFGILMNKPLTTEHATVAVRGQVPVRVGIAATVGSLAISAASGWAVNAVTSFVVASGAVLTSRTAMGVFVTAAASGMLAVVELRPQVYQVNSI